MNFPSSNQTHYTLPPHFRYLLAGTLISTSAFFLIISIIKFTFSLLIGCLIIIPCVIYTCLFLFRRYHRSNEGLYVPNWLNPFQPTLIPWHSIHKISPYSRASFQIQTYDNFRKPVFNADLERFDQFVEAFRSRSIPIEAKKQQIPSTQPNQSDTISLLSSSPKKIRTINSASSFLILFLAILLFVLGCGAMAFGFWISLYAILFGLWMCCNGVCQIAIFLVCVEMTLNGFVRIHYDGVEFPKFPARRTMAHWSDLIYARIVDTPTKHGFIQYLRVYKRGDQDYLAQISVDSDAFHSLMRAFKDHSIPVLKETEEFKPTK